MTTFKGGQLSKPIAAAPVGVAALVPATWGGLTSSQSTCTLPFLIWVFHGTFTTIRQRSIALATHPPRAHRQTQGLQQNGAAAWMAPLQPQAAQLCKAEVVGRWNGHPRSRCDLPSDVGLCLSSSCCSIPGDKGLGSELQAQRQTREKMNGKQSDD